MRNMKGEVEKVGAPIFHPKPQSLRFLLLEAVTRPQGSFIPFFAPKDPALH